MMLKYHKSALLISSASNLSTSNLKSLSWGEKGWVINVLQVDWSGLLDSPGWVSLHAQTVPPCRERQETTAATYAAATKASWLWLVLLSRTCLTFVCVLNGIMMIIFVISFIVFDWIALIRLEFHSDISWGTSKVLYLNLKTEQSDCISGPRFFVVFFSPKKTKKLGNLVQHKLSHVFTAYNHIWIYL